MSADFQIVNGDSLEILRQLSDNVIDAMITDPPAGIGFMGREWDSDKGGRTGWIAWLQSIMTEALRVLKPGAHALVWAIPRTSHWTATAIEEAGFEIRDVVTHHFGTGFPKSLNISKAIDAAAGAERQVVGQGMSGKNRNSYNAAEHPESFGGAFNVTADATAAAAAWHGWGTALKPATEHWILARKPISAASGTVAANVLTHGTGGLNIDACRIGTDEARDAGSARRIAGDRSREEYRTGTGEGPHAQTTQGRWPANLVLSHSPECVTDDSIGDRGTPFGAKNACAEGCPVVEIDAQSGILKTGAIKPGTVGTKANSVFGRFDPAGGSKPREASEGGASRFFYVAKPSTSEREEGLGHLPKKSGADITNRDEDSAGINNPRAGAGRTSAGRANHHPTVKSIALMSWLIKLISPPGGFVLDPFAGSGSTGCAAVLGGWNFLGIEKDPDFAKIAEERVKYWATKAKPETVAPTPETASSTTSESESAA